MLIVLACTLLLTAPGTQGSKRYLVGDESVYDILHRLENLIASLNSTFTQDIAGVRGSMSALQGSVQALQGSAQALQSGLQAEVNERCESGFTQFHKLECSSTSCTETIPVTFSPSFAGTPTVQYGASLMDSEHGMNVRYNIHADSITATSMRLTVNTWADTRLYMIGVSWIACPP